MWGPTTNVGPIGSAVFTFIGYKQSHKKKQSSGVTNFKNGWGK